MRLREALAGCAGDGRPAHHYLTPRGAPGITLTREALHRRVRQVAAGLTEKGVAEGERVALVADDIGEFAATFLAAIWLGAVPVPLPPMPPLGRRTAWLSETGERLKLVQPRLTCASPATLDELAGTGPAAPYPVRSPRGTPPAMAHRPPNAPVYLQFTSGSTGTPRAVVVTEASLAANCAAIIGALSLSPSDVGLSWLPLHHDMGLVGFVCAALVAAVPVLFLPTLGFVRDPTAWMRTVSTYRATVTFGPGFAFALAARRAPTSGLGRLDLSALRVLGCGGEPIRPDAVRRFLDVHRPAGLDPMAFTPSYGLAEATLAVSFGRGLHEEDGAVGCGGALPGHEITIRDDAGRPAPPGRPGEIWLRGPSRAGGYLDEAGDAVFRPDGWLRTGDRGYLHAGDLRVTGRQKDVLIVRGVNLDPQRVEWVMADVPGVRAGSVVAFTRPGADTEELVAVAECPPSARPDLENEVRAVVTQAFGLAVSDFVRVLPGSIPKTTSGKLRRQETRRRYLAGELT